MLCAMAHSTQRGRAALGAADGAGVLLGLLRDPPYQVNEFWWSLRRACCNMMLTSDSARYWTSCVNRPTR